MRKKRLLTLILALSLIICSGTVSYGEDFNIVRWDYEHLPEIKNTESSVFAKDPDNSSVRRHSADIRKKTATPRMMIMKNTPMPRIHMEMMTRIYR